MIGLSGGVRAWEKHNIIQLLAICTLTKSKSNVVKCLSTKECVTGFDVSDQWLRVCV